MIISDSEKFVFIHNPKCGGMSCHNALLQYDTRNNFFFEWKQVNAEGKILDMAHITPFQMRRFFPEAFRGVRDYLKFVFVRNPYHRFLSAVSQHLKLGTPQMRSAILANPETFYYVAGSFAVDALREHAVENNHKMVHFRLQGNFVNIDGHLWADHVFHLETPESLHGTPVAGWLPDMATVSNPTEGYAERGYEVERIGVKAIAALNAFYARDFDSFGYNRL